MRAITYPNGEVVGQSYNAASQLLSVCGGLTSTCNQNYATNLTYNALGQLKQLTLGNHNVTAYDYYGDGGPATNSFRLWQIKTTQASTTLFNLQYGYDNVGNIKTITDTTNSNQVQSFVYDSLDRLMSAQTNAVGNGQYTESYDYNPTGNMTSKAGVGYTYLDGAHKHAVTHLGSMQKYWYDANGNMTKRLEGSVTYTQTFDLENRLTSVQTITGTTAFVYNADGNRVLQTLPNGDKTAYIGNLMEVFIPTTTPPPQPTPTPGPTPTPQSLPYRIYLALIIGNSDTVPLPPTNPLPIPWGQTWKTYYSAGSRLIAIRVASNPNASGDGVFYMTADHLGSTSFTTDNSGNVYSRQTYLPYGQVSYVSGTMPTSKGFTGQRLDSYIQLIHMGARWYDPELGRFISADTIVPQAGNPQALNRYAFVYNNPLKYIDPDGHCPICFGAIVLGAAYITGRVGWEIAINKIPWAYQASHDIVGGALVTSQSEAITAEASHQAVDPILIGAVLRHESAAIERRTLTLVPLAQPGALANFAETLEANIRTDGRASIGPGQIQLRRARELEQLGYVTRRNTNAERIRALLGRKASIEYVAGMLHYTSDQLNTLPGFSDLSQENQQRLILLGYNWGWTKSFRRELSELGMEGFIEKYDYDNKTLDEYLRWQKQNDQK